MNMMSAETTVGSSTLGRKGNGKEEDVVAEHRRNTVESCGCKHSLVNVQKIKKWHHGSWHTQGGVCLLLMWNLVVDDVAIANADVIVIEAKSKYEHTLCY